MPLPAFIDGLVWQEHGAPLPNRMNDLVRGFRFKGHVRFRAKDIYHPSWMPWRCGALIGMVFPTTQPLCHKYPQQRCLWPAFEPLQGRHQRESRRGFEARPHSGTKSRISSKGAGSRFPVDNSSDCASPGPSPRTRRFCSWTNRAPPWILIATRKIEELMLELKTR